jgi:DNA polymerase III subunit epsilon
MREIVLDTETTGLDPADGHRVVEIGAVELLNHMPTGRTYHQYINPERLMPKEAFDVHGIGDDQLRGQPVFATIGKAFLDFIGEARLVIHNASFDMKFLNFELARAQLPEIPAARATDTLLIARQKFPGSPASLDALCRRFGVNNSMREKHGALLDSEILAEVYLELIGGRQPGLTLSGGPDRPKDHQDINMSWRPTPRPQPLPPRLTPAEQAAHLAFVESLGGSAIWKTRS